MQIGLEINLGTIGPEPVRDCAEQVGSMVEEFGFDSIWVPEHVVTFSEYDAACPYPYTDTGRPPAHFSAEGILEPMVALAAFAMTTERVTLGTGVAILPQRNPVYFAKMATTVDLLSAGRFVAGLGLGWSKQEYDALGESFEERGARMNDYVQVVRSLWDDATPSFEGAHYRLPPCVQQPQPSRRIPLFFGGESPAVLNRVARFGDGWFGFRLTPASLIPRLERLERALTAHARSRDELTILVSPGEWGCGAEDLAKYRDLGVDQVVFVVTATDLTSCRAQLEQLARLAIHA